MRPFIFALLLCAVTVQAQPPPSPPSRPAFVVSPEVQPDRTVTFRLAAPDAHMVKVVGEWDQETELTKDEKGVWSVTVGPLESEIYGYSFKVDGVTMLDPMNPAVKPSRSLNSSPLEIPGENATPYAPVPGVPRGTVHLHDYDSKSLGRTRRLRVYTPAACDGKSTERFPVLYLLHGSGDNEAVWTEFGRANIILDNLIAAKKAVPMIVVMTDGHAISGYSAEARTKNAGAFESDLLGDVMPLVEGLYPILKDPEHRAIAGLSMGGNQALLVGLNHRDLFSWIGAMSSAIREPEQPLASFWSDPLSEKTPVRLLWLAIGKSDFLLKENRAFDALLTERKVPHEYKETPGNHRWMVWRRYLAEFAPRLFQETKPVEIK